MSQQESSFATTVKITSDPSSTKAGDSSPLINIFSMHSSKIPFIITSPSPTLNIFLPSLLTHNPPLSVVAFILK